jgi:hypothetical protein
MSVQDKRSKALAYDGGSSEVAVFLTALQAVAVYGAGSTLGWYKPSFQLQTEVGPDRESEDIFDEADNLIKVRTTKDEFILSTEFLQTDDATLKLLDILENPVNSVPLRYPMPTNDEDEDQWIFMYSATVRKENWRLAAGRNADRTRKVTFVASKNLDGLIRDIVTLPSDQTDAAWADYAGFKDARAA